MEVLVGGNESFRSLFIGRWGGGGGGGGRGGALRVPKSKARLGS